VHPEDRIAVEEAIERSRATSQTFEVEYRLLPAGRRNALADFARRYLRNDQGK